MSKSTLPTGLSYTRSIEPSIGFLFTEDDKGALSPLEIQTVTQLGTQSDYSIANHKTPEKLGYANIHSIDTAHMPVNSKALVVDFSVKFLSFSNAPSACNDAGIQEKLATFSEYYAKSGGVFYLAKRYVENLVWANFLHRNRNRAEDIINTITHDENVYTFTPPCCKTKREDYLKSIKKDIEALAKIVEAGLLGKTNNAVFYVTTRVAIPKGVEIFPSQKFLDKDNTVECNKQYSFEMNNGVRQGIFHAVKIGNAIRRIDDWYKNANGQRLPVDPAGVNKAIRKAIRVTNKEDFYTLVENNLDSYIEQLGNAKSLNDIHDSNIHFVAACLIRGGLYSGKGKAK